MVGCVGDTTLTAAAVGPGIGSILPADRFDERTQTVLPRSTEEVAQLLSIATAEGWRVTIQGGGSWHTPKRGDLTISTLGLVSDFDLKAADLVVTVGAGTKISALRHQLDQEDVWLAVDPPGRDRTIGSIVATGTSGPISHEFGPVRDQILGLTVVTGSGRILRLGGQVVKNVAGFDLIRLMTGAYGAYGVITGVTMRVRAAPATDKTLRCTASLTDATAFTDALLASRIHPSACSVRVGPAGKAEVLVRLIGSDPHVRLLSDQIKDLSRLGFQSVPRSETKSLWRQGAIQTGPASVRLGFKQSQVTEAVGLAQESLSGGAMEIGPTRLRWSGNLPPNFPDVRGRATDAGMSVALERGPAEMLDVMGHFARAPEPQRSILDRLQNTFDPGRVLVHALEGTA